jgi:hypothetical protein
MSDFPALPDIALLDDDRERFMERIDEVREELIERLADILDAHDNAEDLAEALEPLLTFYNEANPDLELSPWVRVLVVEGQVLFEAYAPFDEEDEVYDDALLDYLEGTVWWFVDEEEPRDSVDELEDERRDIHEHVAYHLIALFAWGAEDVEW